MDINISNKSKAIVYCAGNNYLQYYERIKNLYDICFLVDGDHQKWGKTIMGHVVCAPEMVDSTGVDVVLIASDRHDILTKVRGIAEELWPKLWIDTLESVFISRHKYRSNGESIKYVDHLNNSFEYFGGNLLSDVNVICYGCNNTFKIRENVIVKDSVTILAYGNDCMLEIGNGTEIGKAVFNLSEGGSIVIGNNCLFASEIELFQNESHPMFDCISGKRLNNSNDINIGNRVWVGKRVTLMGGFSIGEDSVIGYGAISSSSFEKNSCIGGAPAKVIRENVCWAPETVGLYNINDSSDLRIHKFD